MAQLRFQPAPARNTRIISELIQPTTTSIDFSACRSGSGCAWPGARRASPRRRSRKNPFARQSANSRGGPAFRRRGPSTRKPSQSKVEPVARRLARDFAFVSRFASYFASRSPGDLCREKMQSLARKDYLALSPFSEAISRYSTARPRIDPRQRYRPEIMIKKNYPEILKSSSQTSHRWHGF